MVINFSKRDNDCDLILPLDMEIGDTAIIVVSNFQSDIGEIVICVYDDETCNTRYVTLHSQSNIKNFEPFIWPKDVDYDKIQLQLIDIHALIEE